MPYILFADGDEQTRRLGSRWLQQAGYEVKPVASAADALALVREQVPESLVAAAALPDYNGAWLVAKVREHAPRLPVVVISSSADDIPNLEHVSHVIQPFSNDTLIDAINHARTSMTSLPHADRRQTPPCPNCGRLNVRRIPETSQEPQLRWFKCLSCRHIWKKGPRGSTHQT